MQRDAKASSEAQAQKMSVLSASLEEAQRNHHRHLHNDRSCLARSTRTGEY